MRNIAITANKMQLEQGKSRSYIVNINKNNLLQELNKAVLRGNK